MANQNSWLKKRIAEFAYPFNSPWKRLLFHAAFSFTIPLFYLPGSTDKLATYLKINYWILSMDLVQTFSHIIILAWLNERLDWAKQTAKRLIFGVVGHTVVTYSVFYPLGLFNLYLLWGFDFTVGMTILNSVWYAPIIIVSVVMLISSAGEFFNKWKASMINEEKLRTEMMSYKYESLRNQMNPHFLFNSFNVLVNLVNQNPKLAIQFIQQLGELYRNVLETRDKELISLEDELKFIESYIFLLKIRFEDKLLVTIDIPVEKDDLIVPMVLQSLIENVVKHNVISRQKPVEVSICRSNRFIEITNALRPKAVADTSSGTGLQNIKQRYKFFTDKEVQVTQTDSTFKVSIPILKQE